jgi:hypothetical protein
MATEFRVADMLKFHPEWVKDDVPPWVFELLDKAVLRDLALISLDRAKAVHEANVKAIDSAAAILRKAKF